MHSCTGRARTAVRRTHIGGFAVVAVDGLGARVRHSACARVCVRVVGMGVLERGQRMAGGGRGARSLLPYALSFALLHVQLKYRRAHTMLTTTHRRGPTRRGWCRRAGAWTDQSRRPASEVGLMWICVDTRSRVDTSTHKDGVRVVTHGTDPATQPHNTPNSRCQFWRFKPASDPHS